MGSPDLELKGVDVVQGFDRSKIVNIPLVDVLTTSLELTITGLL